MRGLYIVQVVSLILVLSRFSSVRVDSHGKSLPSTRHTQRINVVQCSENERRGNTRDRTVNLKIKGSDRVERSFSSKGRSESEWWDSSP